MLKTLLKITADLTLREKIGVLVACAVSVVLGVVQVGGVTAFVPILDLLSGKDPANIKLFPSLFKYLPADRTWAIAVLLSGIVGMLVLRAVLNGWTQLMQMRLKNAVDSVWQQRVVSHWLRLSPLDHNLASTSKVLHTVSQEVGHLGHAAGAVIVLVSSAVQAAIMLLFLCLVDWRVMLIIAAILLGCILPGIVLVRKLLERSQQDTHLMGRYVERLGETIKRVDLIDIFQTHDKEVSEIGRFLDHYMKIRLDLQRIRVVSPTLVEVGSAFVVCGLVLYFGIFGSEAGLAQGQLILFIGSLALIQPLLSRTNGALALITRMESAARSIDTILAVPPRPDVRQTGRIDGLRGRDLRIDNLAFSYPGRNGAPPAPILTRATATIPAGRLTMLFGASGAGKTTFLKVLARLYAPTDGRILLGDTDIADITPHQWSETVLLMPQENVVFRGTIADNIAYGMDGVPVALEEGAERAAVAEFASRLSDGLNTDAGADGSKLSGGQRQRVALARVIAKKPAVMLLDEPTSALDRFVERDVIANLLDLRQNGTTIVMSTHKVELAKLADHLLWFEGGVVHEGTYEDFQHRLLDLASFFDQKSVSS